MNIKVQCPRCKDKFKVEDWVDGEVVLCPTCNYKLAVPRKKHSKRVIAIGTLILLAFVAGSIVIGNGIVKWDKKKTQQKIKNDLSHLPEQQDENEDVYSEDEPFEEEYEEPPKTPPKPPAPVNKAVEILDWAYKPTKVEYGFVDGAWKATLRNNTSRRIKIYLVITMYDKDGFSIGMLGNAIETLSANETNVFTDTWSMENTEYKRLDNLSLKVQILP